MSPIATARRRRKPTEAGRRCATASAISTYRRFSASTASTTAKYVPPLSSWSATANCPVPEMCVMLISAGDQNGCPFWLHLKPNAKPTAR